VALTPDQRRIQELEKQVRRLEMEKEILKPAVVLMSKIPRQICELLTRLKAKWPVAEFNCVVC